MILQTKQKYLSMVSWPKKVKNGWVWATNPRGRSSYHESASGAQMSDKMVQKKKIYFF